MVDEHKLLKSPLLARLVGDLTSDGNIQIKEWRYLTSFYSKNLEQIQFVQALFRELFHVGGRVYSDKRGNSYKLFIISKPITLFLQKIGTPVGNKTNKKFFVPYWILNGKAELKQGYLQGLFDGEG